MEVVVLLTAAVVVSGQQHIKLDNSHKEHYVDLGSSVPLECSLWTEKSQRSRVSWLFNHNSSSFNGALNISQRTLTLNTSSKETTQDEKGETVTHLISHFTHENVGWYFCEVTREIPFYKNDRTNGTKIDILPRLENTTYLSIMTSKQATKPGRLGRFWEMWVPLGVSALVLTVLLLLTYAILRRRCSKSRGDDPVYANMRPIARKQPSPRPGTVEREGAHLKAFEANWYPSHDKRDHERRQMQKP
ncbi:uncharacterized protein LOC115042513 isoform X2 [Echeneis naucrates]|uniref:uncharacterized protein LOC115042513 isoform X2 n=1 Tax=Echeneis naucrates TaxID=173247 RepID=UPI00111431F2|nr:uncharacterized protein LOC115042513 isoform X2 [Echeneis naucrates]